jgi:hypothetical protein
VRFVGQASSGDGKVMTAEVMEIYFWKIAVATPVDAPVELRTRVFVWEVYG